MDLVIVPEEKAMIQRDLGSFWLFYAMQAMSPLAKVVLKKVVLETRISRLVSQKMSEWAWFSRFYELGHHVVIIWPVEA